MSTRSRYFLAAIGVLFLVLIVLVLYPSADSEEQYLTVAFLDVGQGDAIFIESPTGTQVLIDGGADAAVLRGLSRAMGPLDRTIDMIVATHPDQDHIGGLTEVLPRYEVGTMLMTEQENDTPVAALFDMRVQEEGATVVMARRGQVFDLGRGAHGSTTLTILFPDRDVRGLESNTASIVAKLTYGSIDVLLTGDSPASIEEYLVSQYGFSLASEVLKAGHHGSRTSTTEAFVSAVAPAFGIISAGRDNRYGHPHAEVVERLRAHGVNIKNTAEMGSIFMVSDGKEVWVR